MCTLTYIPITETDFIFTTNRDEDPRRIAFAPEKYLHGGVELTYPKDSKAKGSWIISDGKMRPYVCLMVLLRDIPVKVNTGRVAD